MVSLYHISETPQKRIVGMEFWNGIQFIHERDLLQLRTVNHTKKTYLNRIQNYGVYF